MSDEKPLDEQVRCEDDGGVRRITLDRPEVHNAITGDQRDRVVQLLDEASALVEVRAVVIGATGKGFCTGADLRSGRTEPSRPEGAPERVVGDVSRVIRTGAQRLISAVLDCEKPVIAAVQGTAAGIGAHLALACDLVIAAEGVRFIEIFSKRGLVPDGGGAYLLPRLIGPQKTKELMFFGDALVAEDAAALGLVNKVVPAGDLDAVVDEWAQRLVTGPTRALALTKWLVNRSLDVDRATSFADEALAQELNMTTQDAQEGVASFVERRDPTYRGW